MILFLFISIFYFNSINCQISSSQAAAVDEILKGFGADCKVDGKKCDIVDDRGFDCRFIKRIDCDDAGNVDDFELRNSFGSFRLTGTLSSHIGLLTSLKSLELDRHRLRGTIPSNILQLTSLTALKLDNNQFEGSFSINTLTKLEELDVEDTKIENVLGIPASVDSCTLSGTCITNCIDQCSCSESPARGCPPTPSPSPTAPTSRGQQNSPPTNANQPTSPEDTLPTLPQSNVSTPMNNMQGESSGGGGSLWWVAIVVLLIVACLVVAIILGIRFYNQTKETIRTTKLEEENNDDDQRLSIAYLEENNDVGFSNQQLPPKHVEADSVAERMWGKPEEFSDRFFQLPSN